MNDKFVMRAIEYARDGMYVPPELTRSMLHGEKRNKKIAVLSSYEMVPILNDMGFKDVTVVFDDARKSIHRVAERYNYSVMNLGDVWKMGFDTFVGNPPFNNKGKGAVKNNTSGTSLWIEFLGIIPQHMKPNAECTLVLPRAVLNTNSVGYKKIAHMTVLEANTKIDHHFNIGTKVCTIRFKNCEPIDNRMLIDGIMIDRDLVPVLPNNVCRESISIMKKIGQFDKIEWTRSGWDGFAAADRSKVIGKTFMDRDKHYNFWDFDDMDARNLKKVNLCWIETPYKKKLISLLKKKLFSFHCQQTSLSGNLSIGVMRTLSLPDNWTDLKTDQDVYEAYGLTTKEIAFLEKELV